MKLRQGVTLVLLLTLAIGVAAAGGDTPPSLPHEFYGTVMIGGAPAPAGTVITAMIDGIKSGSITTTVAGRYGGSTMFEGERLVVSGTEEQVGHNVTFLVNGQAAQETASFMAKAVTQLDLNVETTPDTGNVTVTSIPAGAAILLDGTDTGIVTNGTLTGVPVGAHTVAVTLDGYLPASSQVTVSSGETASVNFDLVPETGSIAVTSVPVGAAIFLDGVDTGIVTNGTLTGVPVGIHSVSVTLDGYLPASSQVTVSTGAAVSVHFDLIQESIPALPHEFWGNLTIDGAPAPAGTVITARIGGAARGSVTTTVAGQYGGSSVFEGERLIVSGTDGQSGQTVTFLVNGVPAEETATFTPRAATRLDLHVLTPGTGSIAVTSVPAGAAILLDGVDTGIVTNGTLTGIPVGSHTIAVTLAGYLSSSSEVTVSSGETASVHFDLVPETGSIAVTSVPTGAAIFLDGVDTGVVTNGTLTGVPVGIHSVSVTLDGYLPASSQVTVSSGETASVHFALAQDTGSIEVTSVPAGAAISLDGVDTGIVTNGTLTGIPVGTHTVAVTHDGYLPASSQVTVAANQTASVHFDLTPGTGNLTVTSVPAGAAISLDGINTGVVTNGTLTGVSVGDHNVTVTLAGYSPASSRVTVVSGATASVHFDLATPVHPPAANFIAAPTDGAVPLSVRFTDTSTNATAWSWDFGDGNTSAEQHPAHTYTAIGWFNVTLTVTNSAGSDTLTRARYINGRDIPPEPAENTTDFDLHDNGTTVNDVGGRQQVSFNATTGNGTVSGNDIVLERGNVNVTIQTDGLTTAGNVSTGNVTGVQLESSQPATASLDEAGNVSVAFNASMNGYNPDLGISLSIYNQPSTLASTAFTLAAANDGLEITSTAYAVYFTKTNLGANDTISDAYLRMTVSPAWVEANGGPEAIRIFRQGDDGDTEALATTYLGLDENGMMIFEAYSPNGFSAFAIAATKAAVTPTPTSSSSGSGGGGSSAKPTTSTGTAELLTASWGGVLRPYIVYTDGESAHLYLRTGVTALNNDGKPLPEVGIAAVSSLPSASSLTFSGYAINCTPDGAAFSPAIDLVFTFTEEEWTALLEIAGGDPSRLIVQGYEASAGEWEDCPTSVNAAERAVSASITHFSTYGLFIEAAAEEPVTTGQAATPTATTIASAAAPTPSTETDGALPLTWIVLLVIVAAVLIGGYVVVKRR